MITSPSSRAGHGKTLLQDLLEFLVGLALVIAAAYVVSGACSPRPAHASLRVPLEWTAPTGARTYEVRARRPDNVYLSLLVFGDSVGAGGPVIANPGAPQRVWVAVSEDWRQGGWILQARACNGAGCAEWSNPVLVAAGVPDTAWTFERGPGGLFVDGPAWKLSHRRVSWTFSYGDTAAARVIHQEELQARERTRLCELYGYWLLRGVRQACP